MSKRPIEQKQRNKVARKLRRKDLPAYFDLVQWLIDHRHAKTKKEAREIILAKRCKAASHVIGIGSETRPAQDYAVTGKFEQVDVVAPLVSVAVKKEVLVSSK